jgi:hypothetical protein
MGQLLSVILHQYHQCHGIFVLIVAAVGLSWGSGRMLRRCIGSPAMINLAIVLAVLVTATYFAVMALRLIGVGYGDHLEATVASISWLVVHGRPAYPDWHDGDLYGGIYGPLLFWIDGAALLVSPTIAVTKLAAAGALSLGMAGLWVLSRRAITGWPARLLLAALLVEQLIPYRFTAYWIRSEPFLYLLAALAILAAAGRRPRLAMLLVGLLAGLASDLKIHAPVYMLPAGLLLLARVRAVKEMAVLVAIAGAAALVAFIAPALADPSVTLLYTHYLAMAAGHGLSVGAVVENIEIAAALATPPLILFLWRRPLLARSDIWFAAGLGISTVALVILGSKVGALMNYLMPLAPSVFYLTVRLLAAPPREAEPPGGTPGAQLGLLATSFLIVLACNAASWLLMLEMAPGWPAYNQLQKARQAEFVALLDAHPDAETGAAGDGNYEDSYFAALQVMRNGLLHIAVPAWMDLREGGVDETYARRFIEGCATPAWLLPNGPPFSLVTPYSGLPLFSDDFRAAFARNYRPADRRNFYTVWTCQAGK